MAQVPEIKIQLDEEALRQQITSVIEEQFIQFSWRLRAAADAIDAGTWVKNQEAWVKSEYERGFSAGKRAQEDAA